MDPFVLIFDSKGNKKYWADGIRPVHFKDAINAARERGVVLPKIYYGKLQGLARSLAFTITGIEKLTLIQKILDTLNESMEQGESFYNWKKKIKNRSISLELPKHRLELIFRNAVQNAYSRGRSEHFYRHKKTRPYLKYSAVNDSRTRPSHGAMHGTVLPVDDPWWNTHTPPNGHACRCTVMSLSEKQTKRLGGTTYPEPEASPDPGWNYNLRKMPGHWIESHLHKLADRLPAKLTPFIDNLIQGTKNTGR